MFNYIYIIHADLYVQIIYEMTREESFRKISLYRKKNQIQLEYEVRFNIYFKDEGQSPQEHGEELQ